MADGEGVRPTPEALLDTSQRWRPWRAYAAQHLWAADAAQPVQKRTKTDDRRAA
jgi:AraC family transcriptional regulator of adaptative response / DNA-3-methyladenine glycosylase II